VAKTQSNPAAANAREQPKRPFALGFKGCVLAAALVCAAVQAQTAPRTASLPEDRDRDEDAARQCLRVHGNLESSQVMLRVAMPPMDPEGSGGILQAIAARLASAPSGAGVKPSGSQPQNPSGLFHPLSPVVRLIVDGSTDALAGRHADAERGLTECKRLAAEQKDSLAAAACANNLAVALAAQGRHAQARTELEWALQQYGAPREPPANLKPNPAFEAVIGQMTSQLPALLAMMSPEQRAQFEAQWKSQQPQMDAKIGAANQMAWRHTERLNTLRGLELTRLNLGNLALATGRLSDAEASLRRAMNDRVPNEPPACLAAAAMDLARLLHRLGRPDESRALLARHRTGPSTDAQFTMFEIGGVGLALARGGGPTTAAAVPREPASPDTRRETSVIELSEAQLFKEPSARLSDDALARLWTQASSLKTTSRSRQESADAWARLALRARAAQRPDLAFTAHAELMRVHAALGNAGAAVLHGKRAVQVAQAGRAALEDKSPSRDARRAFLRERRQVYVELAQALLDARRLHEAEAVLQLLKEDEGQQFMAAGSAVGAVGIGALPLTSAERDLSARDDAAIEQLRRAEQARVSAVSGVPVGGGALLMLTPEQIETFRLQLGLTLADLPSTLKQTPLAEPAGGDARSQLRKLRGFLLGPERRLEQFLSHLIEDAAQFSPAVSSQHVARLSEIAKRVRQIQAELAPLLHDDALDDAAATSALQRGRARPATDAESGKDNGAAWNYLGAEAAERLWRGARAADSLEAQHLRDAAERTARTLGAAAPPASGAGARDPMLALLASQPTPTAMLYYLPGEDRLDVLLVSAKDRRHWRLAVPRAELDRQVDEFAQLMRRTDRDPRPAAKGLYDRLFAPVAQAVADSGAKLVALSLVGKLRFVPFAALHDGTGWLVERYALALHPGGPVGDRLKPASANWRAAAFGASEGGGEFPPLLSVRGEIGSVVRQAGASSGVLPGEAWLDKDFTAKRLRAALGSGAQVLHIASHFKFVGGDAQASYLLLGDGAKLSLRELAGADYRFDRVELVTLSACATGLSADDTYGQEVDGLAALLMGQGAPSVLASLWEVNDRSTATLMGTLYRLREGGQLSRAFALQQAQWTMIRSQAETATPADSRDAAPRGVTRIRLPGEPEPEPGDRIGAPPVALGYSHPFHWAAFVLMGNWR
jgi:CHAT domain-containing protein